MAWNDVPSMAPLHDAVSAHAKSPMQEIHRLMK